MSETPPEVAERRDARARRRRRRRWTRLGLIALLAPVAALVMLGLAIGGPPLVVAVFLPSMGLLILVDWLAGSRRRAALRADLRDRRAREMRRAIERGGPNDLPAKPHRSPDPGEAERTLFRRRMPSVIASFFPRGRL